MTFPTLLRFGRCEVHSSQRTVRLEGQPQPVAPKVFELLALLLKERHRVVPKQELMETLWQGQRVTDSVLARTVMQARRAIRDSASQPAWIKTIHRYGYRFVGEVFEATEDGAGDAVRRAADKAADPATPGRQRIGVLPCQNRTGDRLLDWSELGLMALVGQALETDERLEVMPAATMLEAVATVPRDAPATERAKVALHTLGLKRVLLATLRRQAHDLWLDYQIVSGGDETTLTGSLRESDPSRMGDGLAKAVIAALFKRPDVEPHFDSRDPFANQAFARALQLFTEMRFESARQLMAVVIDIEPSSQVAQLWNLRLLALTGDASALPASQALLDRAELQGDLRLRALAHRLLGDVIAQHEGPIDAARHHLEEALRLARGQGLFELVNHCYMDLAAHAMARGEFDRARMLFETASAGFRASDNAAFPGFIEHSLATLAWDAGDPLRARQGFEDALVILRRTHHDAFATQTLARLAEVNATFGLFQLAESQCQDALAATARLEHSPATAAIVSHAANVMGWRGSALDVERALEHCAGMEDDRRPAVRSPLAAAMGWRDLLRGDLGELRRRACAAVEDRLFERASVRTLLALWLRAEDAASNEHGIAAARARIAERNASGGRVALRACVMVSEASEACARGDVPRALSKLSAVVQEHSWAQLHAPLSRLNAAWLELEQGNEAAARYMLAGVGAWRTEYPAGLATEARLKFARGQAAEACELQRRALATFRGPPPPVHQGLLECYAAAADGQPVPELPRLRKLISDSWLPPMR